MLVACLTSLVALNGKNHAGTGIPQLFTFTQPLKRAQDDAFGPPTMMSLVEITAMGPPSYSTSVYVPAAMRAVAVLTPFSVHDYIESEGILFPRGMVPKYPKMIPDFKPIDDFIHISDGEF